MLFFAPDSHFHVAAVLFLPLPSDLLPLFHLGSVEYIFLCNIVTTNLAAENHSQSLCGIYCELKGDHSA